MTAPDPSLSSSSSFGVEREQELSEQNQAALDLGDALARELYRLDDEEFGGRPGSFDREGPACQDEYHRKGACLAAVAESLASRLALQEDPVTKESGAESAVLLRAAAEFEYHAGNRSPGLTNKENRALSDANIRAAVHLRHLAHYGFNPVAQCPAPIGEAHQ